MNDDRNDMIIATKRITKNGHSLTVNITHEVKLMDLKKGDEVIVSLKRKDYNGDHI